MKTEIEAKFLHIAIDDIRSRLEQAGAELVAPMRLMRRAIIDYPDMRLQHQRNGYVRVRDEGHRVTLTYKQFDALSIDGAKEYEVTVDSFDHSVAIFTEIGLQVRSIQESKRETWRLNDAEIVIDEWPWLRPYIEIESESEPAVRKAAEALGFDWADASFGDIMAAYRLDYPQLSERDNVGSLPEVRFGAPLPDMFKKLT